MRKQFLIQLPLSRLLLTFLLSASGLLAAPGPSEGAYISINLANNTSTPSDLFDAAEGPRELSSVPPPGLTLTSYLTATQLITAPAQTTTAVSDGTPGSETTAATSPTPTAVCSVPPQVAAPCELSNPADSCIKAHYSALKTCYQTGTLPTAKNIAQYYIDCQDELGETGSYDSFRFCSLDHVARRVNETPTVRKRSVVELGNTVLVMEDDFADALDDAGVIMMDESELWEQKYGTNDDWLHSEMV
ncbi:hypothetical protein DRE_04015 [Drechslerella stenobrocha 248]|uniref:Extracellular membrane protein CFEM domain-containing protein n=1 Tax=Drechslerella stenobrocha 248 TaxID=1043628 RepID=W7ICE2_9PEZI|nr:hypothetical protein DRE_04015 [Drechslerella stenobrocha 248]